MIYIDAKDQRITELRRQLDEARHTADKWESRFRDDQGVWLATRDANIELTKRVKAAEDEIAKYKSIPKSEDYRELVEKCVNMAAYHQGDPELAQPIEMLLGAFRRLEAAQEARASYSDKLYEDHEEIVPYTGYYEPGASVTIHWKPIEGEVGGPFTDHGYVFVYPHADEDVGACVHIPKPDPRGDRDVSPEWPTVAELLSNTLIERIEFTERPTPPGARATPPGAQRLVTSDDRYEAEVAMIQQLAKAGIITIRRGLLTEEIGRAKAQLEGNAA